MCWNLLVLVMRLAAAFQLRRVLSAEVVRAACWPPPRNVHTVRVDHFSYSTLYRWCFHVPVSPYPTRAEDFLPQITLRRVTPTITHLGLAKVIGLLYLYMVSLTVIVRVSYGHGYIRGSGQTDINARCVPSNSLCKLGAERANEQLRYS